MEGIRFVTQSVASKRLPKITSFLDSIKFPESIFALPFAYIGMVLAKEGLPTIHQFFWITIAMVSARTVGMVANRIIDRNIDAKNPRTSSRHLPSGILKVKDLAIPGAASFCIFMFSAWQLNTTALILAPVAAAYLIVYPYTKRVTWTANLLLGWALAIAPAAAWVGITGSLTWKPVLLSLSVALWAGSFDIIYHCQDVAFQKKERLHSVAEKFGIPKAFGMARLMDVGALISLISLGIWMELEAPYYIGCAVSGIFITYKYFLVTPNDLSKMGMAFMRINSFVSVSMLAGTLVSVFLWP